MNNYEDLIDRLTNATDMPDDDDGAFVWFSRITDEAADTIKQLVAERDELVAGITRMIGRFDRFEVPFTLAELRRQVAALAKVGAEKTGEV